MKISFYFLLSTILIVNFSCKKPAVEDETNLEFLCNGVDGEIIFEGKLENNSFCYSKTDGYSVKFLNRLVYTSNSNTLKLDDDSVKIHSIWEISDSDYSEFRHRITLISPILDSTATFFLENLKEGDLELLNQNNPFSVEFAFNRIKGGVSYIGSSLIDDQGDNNFIRINSIEKKRIGGEMRILIEFEFCVKIYSISHNNEYFGELYGLFSSELSL